MDPTLIRLAIDYSGRVQGVGFRATARSVAAGYPVTGHVANQPDGSVHLQVQGPPRQVEAFRDTLRLRMEHNIHDERAAPIAIVPGEQGFEIRR
jgi:acylphosphatase